MFWEGLESWGRFNPGELPGGGGRLGQNFKGIEKMDGNILNDLASER